MIAQKEIYVKVKHLMVSLSVHLSVSILSSTFYDFIYFKYVQPLSVSVIPQYQHDRNACTFQISLNQHLCLE